MIKRTITRRRVLVGSAGASSLIALSACESAAPARSDIDIPTPADRRAGYLFFNPIEAAFIEAAVARLIPNDELGAGALEAGVPLFIDRQLAGPYGQGDHFYLQGPFSHAEKTQGWQMPNPAAVYRTAIPDVNHVSLDVMGATFARLSKDHQDEVLAALEKGEAKLPGPIEASAFFELLLQNTVEGFFSDPLYGGNHDMAGWKLIGFPGARYNHREFVSHHGQPYPLPPVAIGGRAAWNRS